jgi:hypothetical protein
MGNKSTNPSKTNPQPISLTPTFLEFPLHTTKQFLGLGEDVLSLVLALVPPPQLFALARVCRCWYLLLRGDRVWCGLKRGTKDLPPSLTARQYWICLTIDVASESFGPTVNEVVAQVLRHTPGEDVELVAYKR